MNNYNGMYQQPSPANGYYPYVARQMSNTPYQPVTSPMSQPQNNLDWIMVPTTSQVESVTVQPGQKAWIMVQNEPIFALRTADNMGLVSTDYYRFERCNPAKETPKTEYVTKSEMEQAIRSAIDSIGATAATVITEGEQYNEPTISEDKSKQYVPAKGPRFPFKNEERK